MRWAELSPVWQACLEEAWAAYGAGALPIGAVITDAVGQILARGRNQIEGDGSGPGLVHWHPLAHAELNALLALTYGTIDPHQCALYTTTEPCPLCLGAFYMSGLRTLRYASRDPYAGSANLLGTTPYLRHKPIRAYGPASVELEEVLVALNTERHLSLWGEQAETPVLATWRVSLARAVALGEHLWQTQALAQMHAQKALAGDMVDDLSQRLARGF